MRQAAEDEQVRRALAASRADDEDEQLQRALAASREQDSDQTEEAILQSVLAESARLEEEKERRREEMPSGFATPLTSINLNAAIRPSRFASCHACFSCRACPARPCAARSLL